MDKIIICPDCNRIISTRFPLHNCPAAQMSLPARMLAAVTRMGQILIEYEAAYHEILFLDNRDFGENANWVEELAASLETARIAAKAIKEDAQMRAEDWITNMDDIDRAEVELGPWLALAHAASATAGMALGEAKEKDNRYKELYGYAMGLALALAAAEQEARKE